jgi:hypothetical protein
MAKNFKRPIIIAAIIAKQEKPSSAIAKALRGVKGDIKYVPIRISSKDLKNIVKCMKLVDIPAATISPTLRKKAFLHLDHRDESSIKAKESDLIIKKGQNYVAFNAKGVAKNKNRHYSELCAILLTSNLEL